MEEKRAALRRRTYLAAQITSHDGIEWAPGLVRNLSATGASIEAAGAPLPEAVRLAVPMTGLRTHARVVWRAGARAGLQFLATTPAPKPIAHRYDDDPNY